MDQEMERVAGIIDNEDKFNDMTSCASTMINPEGESIDKNN
jgi:hypothetical protein